MEIIYFVNINYYTVKTHLSDVIKGIKNIYEKPELVIKVRIHLLHEAIQKENSFECVNGMKCLLF